MELGDEEGDKSIKNTQEGYYGKVSANINEIEQ